MMALSSMDEFLGRIIAIARLRKREAVGREQAWLAEKLATSVQAVNNWSTKGVPAKRHEQIADALGISVDELLGREMKRDPSWPFETVSRHKFDALSERQKGVIESEISRLIDRLAENGIDSDQKQSKLNA